MVPIFLHTSLLFKESGPFGFEILKNSCTAECHRININFHEQLEASETSKNISHYTENEVFH